MASRQSMTSMMTAMITTWSTARMSCETAVSKNRAIASTSLVTLLTSSPVERLSKKSSDRVCRCSASRVCSV